MSDPTFEEKWKKFESECRECTACPLHETRTHTVISRGSKHAPLMMIGEAPGKDEDQMGSPFVGRSGQLLQHLLAAYGLKDRDYHICNIVKCRPPENRRPEPAEIAACKKHLAVQFNFVRPKVILLLGSTAYEAFFGIKPVMKDVRGYFVDKNGYKILTTFHPAFALRNEHMKIPLYEDVGKVKALLEEMGLVEITGNTLS